MGGGQPLSDSERQAMIERIIRVDHAGELGRRPHLRGTIGRFVQDCPSPMVIKHMWDQEKEHLSTMERLVTKHGVAPTVFSAAVECRRFRFG